MTLDPADMLRRYREGLGFRSGDVLQPRDGANPPAFGVVESKVVVLEQSSLAPHQYTVIGENPTPREPSDRFVKFEINGHDWQKVGRA